MRISAFLDRVLRASSPTQAMTCRKIRHSSRTPQPKIVHDGHCLGMPQATAVDNQFGTHRDGDVVGHLRWMTYSAPTGPLVGDVDAGVRLRFDQVEHRRGGIPWFSWHGPVSGQVRSLSASRHYSTWRATRKCLLVDGTARHRAESVATGSESAGC